jgi:aspartate/methionine/tyrosine aminotransferase
VNVLSKAFGFPGLRIGWAATKSQEAISVMASIKDYTTNCCAAPSETLACIAIEARDNILGRTSQIAADNMNVLNDFFHRHRELFEWMPLLVGCIGFAKLKKNPTFLDGTEFCERLLKEEGILLLPGSVYGDTWGEFFRVSWGRQDMKEGIAKLEEWLSRVQL